MDLRDYIIEWLGDKNRGLIILFIMLSLMMACNAQTKQEVLDYCKELEIKHPEIVTKQAILETGHFKCKNCSLDYNNLFGFFRCGSYIKFDHWKESIKYYKKWQDSLYNSGDYYQFLDCLYKLNGKCIRYAGNKQYTNKLKAIRL